MWIKHFPTHTHICWMTPLWPPLGSLWWPCPWSGTSVAPASGVDWKEEHTWLTLDANIPSYIIQSSFIKPILCITTVQIAEQVETHKKLIHTPCQPETPAVSSGHSETKAWSCRKCMRSCKCFQTRTSVGREWDEDWGRWLGRTQGINICKGKEKERDIYIVWLWIHLECYPTLWDSVHGKKGRKKDTRIQRRSSCSRWRGSCPRLRFCGCGGKRGAAWSRCLWRTSC